MPAILRSEINTAADKSITAKQPARKHTVITEISVTARIDYILRFSKQAVLVVADQTEQYSAIARQFLVTLSNRVPNEETDNDQSRNGQCNVAFVAASIKLNDIQIRCRLIEQLFGDSLFDPEQSLAVSVLRLAKQQGEAITVIVEHAHALSLQVKYELSQLAAIAKKNNQEINVVMFGHTKAATDIGNNNSIFKNKLATIDAASGQLYSRKTSNQTQRNNSVYLKLWHKVVLIVGFLSMVVISAGLFYYLQTDQGSEYLQQSMMMENKEVINAEQFTKPEKELATTALINRNLPDKPSIVKTNTTSEAANAQEITLALLNPDYGVIQKNISAKSDDVLNALLEKEQLAVKAIHSEKDRVDSLNLEKSELAKVSPQLINTLDIDYYTNSNHAEGVVVQIAGFSDSQHWQKFIALYPQQEFYSYQKLLSGSVFTVVTSKIYSNREEAKTAVQDLPAAIAERQLWLKPISTVITEINTFKG